MFAAKTNASYLPASTRQRDRVPDVNPNPPGKILYKPTLRLPRRLLPCAPDWIGVISTISAYRAVLFTRRLPSEEAQNVGGSLPRHAWSL